MASVNCETEMWKKNVSAASACVGFVNHKLLFVPDRIHSVRSVFAPPTTLCRWTPLHSTFSHHRLSGWELSRKCARAKMFKVKSWQIHLWILWPWASYRIALYLSFLLSKNGNTTGFCLIGLCWKRRELICAKCLAQYLAPNKHLCVHSCNYHYLGDCGQ